jgi:hypothetical protein
MTPLQQLVAVAQSQDMVWREEQAALTASLLMPAMPEVVDLLDRLRRECDGFIAGQTPPATGYPIGFCAVIRDRVFDGLISAPLIGGLTARGLALQKVFVILKDRYFQNAIQFGNLYIDVANDSVDPSKPWLEWMDVREVPFANVGDLSTIARVAGDYHRCGVHPNTFFPPLAPVVPLLAVHDDGRLGLLHFQDGGFLKDLASGFPHLRHWLAGPARDLPPLPEAHAEALREACGREHRDAFAFEYRPCSFVDIAEHADAFSAVFADPSRHWSIMAVCNRVPEALRDLRARNIRGG